MSGKLRSLLPVLLLVCSVLPSPLAAQVVVVVDEESGNDTTCLSALELISSNQTTSSVPCRTLDRALGNTESCSRACVDGVPSEERLSGVVFKLADGNHILTGAACVVQGEDISFEAINSGRATLKCPNFPDVRNQFENLAVCGTTGVKFTGMRFEHCGPYSANVFITRSTDIVFEDCVIANNSGAGLVAQFSGHVRLTNTHFLDNVNLQEPLPDVNETSIEELYNSITRGGSFTFFNEDSNDVEIIIENCTFVSNVPSRNDINNSRPVLLKAHGHGGGVLIRLANVHNSHVTIENCSFDNNQAEVDGGAVYLSLSRQLSSNTFTFRNNNFTNNVVQLASGGAISVNSFNFTSNNTILVEDCFFQGNGGNAGGAFSLALYDSDSNSTEHPDVVNFTRCIFRSNTAHNEGTAVGLFSLVHVDQVGFPISFENCTFRNNTSLEESKDTSAIAAFRFPTIFYGANHFIDNVGGGITLLNTRMQASGTLRFERNTAVFGGGMAMDDRCLLEVSPNTTVMFLNNTASESGGGIYVEFPPIRFVVDIFNRLCFLQYNDGTGVDIPPQDWVNVNITFVNNQARLSGAAIYASDMQQCSWLGSDFTTSGSIIFDPPEVLTNSSNYPFQYINNTLLPEGLNVSLLTNRHLATAPSMIHLMAPYSKVQPGETLQINLLATDQVDNSREAVWSLEAPNQQANLDALSANNDSYPYRVPAVFNLPGYNDSSSSLAPTTPPGNEQSTMGTTPSRNEIIINEDFASSFTLNFSLLRTLGSISTLDLAVNGCHPGYVLDQQSGECTCDTDDSAILRCDDNNRYIYLREGIWGGVQDNKLITARVQPGYVTCDSQGRLPGCRFKFDNQDAQCRSGRRGPLCGQCTDGRGVTLDLQSCTSISCYVGVALFTVLCVGVIIVSALMLFLDVKLPNELKGFIFYAQVVGLVYRPYIVVQTDSTTDALSIVLNVLGFSVPLPLCISQTIGAHYIALFGYLSPLLASITIAAFVVGARKIRPLAHHSALNGITFLSLFFYKYIADTSFIFISCINTDLGFVFQYDGSQECLGLEFGFFFFLGLILALFFVLPTPFIISYICIRRPLRFQQYADVLTNGLKARHRWWGGWDIGRRLPFVIIAYFVVLARPSLVLFLMSLASLFVLVVHLFTKPFEKMYINVIEAAILLNLLMVTAAFLDPSNSPVPLWFGTLLVFLPYAYAMCYLIYMIGSHIRKKIAKKSEGMDLTKKMHMDTIATGNRTEENTTTAATITGGSIRTKEGMTIDKERGSAKEDGRQESGADCRNTVSSPSAEEDYTALREPLLDD